MFRSITDLIDAIIYSDISRSKY